MYYAKNNSAEFDVTASYQTVDDLWDFVLWCIPDVRLDDWDFYDAETNEIVKFPCANQDRCSAKVQHPDTPCEDCDY